MRFILALTFFFFLIGLSCFAQANVEATSDSLERQLKKTLSDVEQVNVLGQLGNLWYNKDSKKSFQYLEEALKISRDKNLKESEINLTLSLAFAYRLNGDFPKSIEMLQRILSKVKIAPEDRIQPIVLAFISMNYYDIGDYQNALFYHRTTRLYLPPPPSDIKGYLNDPKSYANIFEAMNQIDSAFHYIKIAYFRLHNTPSSPAKDEFAWTIPVIYGRIEEKKGNDKHALQLYYEGLAAAVRDKYELGIHSTQCQLAKYYQKHHNADSTLYFAKNAFERALKIPTYQVIQDAGFLLKEYYEKNNDTKKALYYYTLANAAKDSIFNNQKLHKIQNLTLNNERQRKEAELLLMETQSQNKQYVLWIGLLFVSIIVAILYRNNYQKNNLNKQLAQQKNEIEELNSDLEKKVEIRTAELKQALNEVQTAFAKGQTVERKRVSADLHDEIGAALSTIAIFSDVTKSKAQNTAPELVNELDRIGRKSREMVQIMRDTIWTMNDDSPQSIWTRMYMAATETLSAKDIELQWNMPNEDTLPVLSFNKKRNLFLAFKEAINNIMKHAEPSLVVFECVMRNDEIFITIADNGKGFNSKNADNKGNGLRNFENRMKEISGSFEIESKVGQGTSLGFSFSAAT